MKNMRSQFVLISDFLATVIKLSFNLRENPGKKNIAQVTESRTNTVLLKENTG